MAASSMPVADGLGLGEGADVGVTEAPGLASMRAVEAAGPLHAAAMSSRAPPMASSLGIRAARFDGVEVMLPVRS